MPRLTPVPFDAAIRHANDRGVVLPAVYYGEIQGAARAHAFTVSFLVALRQIQTVLDAVIDALESGMTYAAFARQIRERGIALSDPHRETVFRTAVQTSYNAGRREQQIATRSTRPFLMYDAINDSRTRPTHRAMDGFIAPASNRVWKKWYPPNGYNCRCSVIALTADEARKRGWKRTRVPSVEPDEGWDYDVNDRWQTVGRLDETLDDALQTTPDVIRRAVRRVKK